MTHTDTQAHTCDGALARGIAVSAAKQKTKNIQRPGGCTQPKAPQRALVQVFEKMPWRMHSTKTTKQLIVSEFLPDLAVHARTWASNLSITLFKVDLSVYLSI